MRLRTKLLAGTAVVAILGAGHATASADDPSAVPWAQRPITVGSGFRLGTDKTDFPSAIVSRSGRWVVFVSNSVITDDDPDTEYDTFLRDRWTDTTRRIHAGYAASMTMSADGNLIAGTNGPSATSTGWRSWVHDQRTGRTVELPAAGAAKPPHIIEINNDGYFLAEFGELGQQRPDSTVSGRVSPDGTLSKYGSTAAGTRMVFDATPSMRYAVVEQPATVERWRLTQPARVDMTTGATMLPPAGFLPAPLPADPRYEYSAAPIDGAISPNGRFVAVTWQVNAYDLDVGVIDWQFELRLWDTTTNTFTTKPMGDRSVWYADGTAISVLNDGRVLTLENNRQVLLDPRLPNATPFDIGTTFAGETDWTAAGNNGSFGSVRIADDINRVVYCTHGALSAYDTNGTTDCYLKTFPAAG